MNETALLEMVTAVYGRVQTALRAERFPLIYGGDCAVLLGTVPAVRDVCGSAGLLLVDGHEDATTMEESTTGEVANMEIALLLGVTGAHAPESLRGQLPALRPDTIVMLGQRDADYRRRIGVPSMADRVRVCAIDSLRPNPDRIAAEATAQIASHVPAWWLHVDLDVLDRSEFRACGAATDPSMPEGLTWPELTGITRTALKSAGCRGWSVTVYNPDLDADGRDAQRIVSYIDEAIGYGRRPYDWTRPT